MAILTLVASIPPPQGVALGDKEILEYCEKVKAVILSKEQFYLDLLKPEYNILKVAGSSLGYKHTVETILKMIGSYISKNLGIQKSEEHKAKLRAYMKGKTNTYNLSQRK